MHLAQNDRGTWTAVVQVNGRRRKLTRATRKEARAAAVEVELELGGAPRANPTVAELLADWQATHQMSATYRADADRIIGRLPATFTGRKLSEVTPRVVEQLHRQLATLGLTVHRRRRAHEVLSSAWTLALRWEQAKSNPFSHVPKPAVGRRADTTPDLEAARQLAEVAARQHPRLHLFVVLAAATGARRGELCALQWADLRDGSLSIGRSLSYTPATGVVIGDGKIGRRGWRTLALDGEILDKLEDLYVEQARLAAAAELPAPTWIFSLDAGQRPWRPDYITHEFAKLRATAGLPTVRLHDLRHFSATQLLAAGVPIHVVSKRLGHRQESTTSGRYGHQVPAAEQQAAATIGRMLGSGSFDG